MLRWIVIAVLLSVAAAVPAVAQVDCDARIDHFAAGSAALAEGNYTQAIAHFDCVLEAAPENYEAQWGRIEAQLLANWLEDAPYFLIAEVAELEAAAPELIERAVADATARIAAEPKAIENYVIRAFLYWWLADDDLALLDYEQIMLLNPDLAATYAYRGSSRIYLGEVETGAADFAQAFELAPDLARLRTLLATTLLDVGAAEQALEPASAAVELAPDVPVVYIVRGNVYRALDNLDSALADYNRVLEMDPNNAEVYAARAAVYVAQGSTEAAQADFDQAVALDPNPGFYYDFALAHEAAGDMPAAAGIFAALFDQFRNEFIDGDALLFGEPQTLAQTFGRVYRLPLALETGQMIDLSASSPKDAVDVLIVLLAPDGSPLVYHDDVDVDNDNLGSLISGFAVPTDGTYTLLVSHAGGNPEGDVEVLLTPTE